ncbi:MAG TPA: patatin-like phospholipase family protein [Candidatus Thermoplasmatota archaeon]|nr:patatin-like phospholipase family protein [Candidatus Thermoplasmatota archaeon]
MKAVVLSGGGARGAYEFGVYKALHRAGLEPDLITGTSVGAITGALIASGASIEQMEEVWMNLHTSNLLRMRKDIWGLPRWTHFCEESPLREIIERNVDFKALRESRIKLAITAIDVQTGQTHTFTNREIGMEHLLATAAIPLVFPMVDVGGTPFWDGGLAGGTPLKPAVKLGATEIYAIVVSPMTTGSLPPPTNLLESMSRLMEIVEVTALREDVRHAQRLNDLVAKGLARDVYRHIDIHVIGPKEPLGVSILDFAPGKAKALIARGEEEGQRFAEAMLKARSVPVVTAQPAAAQPALVEPAVAAEE